MKESLKIASKWIYYQKYAEIYVFQYKNNNIFLSKHTSFTPWINNYYYLLSFSEALDN